MNSRIYRMQIELTIKYIFRWPKGITLKSFNITIEINIWISPKCTNRHYQIDFLKHYKLNTPLLSVIIIYLYSGISYFLINSYIKVGS